MLKTYWISLTLLVLTVTVGCATRSINLPAVTESPTNEFQPGKIIWHDLITDKPAQSRKFYESLFGWEFESVGTVFGLGSNETYSLIRHKGRLIGGMVDARQLGEGKNISQWIVLMSVANIDVSIDALKRDGGTVLTPATNIADRGRMAVVADPQGALLALLQTKDGDPPDRKPEYGDFLWNELWTTDVDAATSFYQQVVDFDLRDIAVDDGEKDNYRVLQTSGEPRVGVMNQPFEGESPVWVSYLRVEDPAAITARVESLGGQIYLQARKRAIGGEVAFIAGPSGAGIALQTWPLDRQQESAR